MGQLTISGVRFCIWTSAGPQESSSAASRFNRHDIVFLDALVSTGLLGMNAWQSVTGCFGGVGLLGMAFLFDNLDVGHILDGKGSYRE